MKIRKDPLKGRDDSEGFCVSIVGPTAKYTAWRERASVVSTAHMYGTVPATDHQDRAGQRDDDTRWTSQRHHRSWVKGHGVDVEDLRSGAASRPVAPTDDEHSHAAGSCLATTEVIDTVTMTFAPGPSMQAQRYGCAAVLPPGGRRVLVVGGLDGSTDHATVTRRRSSTSTP